MVVDINECDFNNDYFHFTKMKLKYLKFLKNIENILQKLRILLKKEILVKI